MSPHSPRRAWLAAPLVLASLAFPVAAHAETSAASQTITGGSLAFVNGSPSAVTFPTTALSGTDQTTTQTQLLDISDARGTGVGWNITATSTFFTNGSSTLPTGSARITTPPAVACASGVTCVTPTNSVGLPYNLPAGTTAPLATKMYNAAVGTGTGAMSVTPTWRLLIPATAIVGTYSSTWTLSLTSGP